jgi:hypothetical protein
MPTAVSSLLLVPLLVLAGAVSSLRTPDELAAAPAPAPNLKDMAWIAGTWSGDAWGGRFVAYYSTPEGGKVLSHSRLQKDGKEAFYEFEVFDMGGDQIRLQPFPGGKRAHGFLLKELDAAARRAVFENPKKDYPTRIVYECPTPDNLVITLSDPHGKSGKTERFDLRH